MTVRPNGSSPRDTGVLVHLTEIIRLVTERPGLDVRLEQSFVDDLQIDSLAMVEILEGTAQHFAVRLDDEDAKDFVAVGDLVDHVVARLG